MLIARPPLAGAQAGAPPVSTGSTALSSQATQTSRHPEDSRPLVDLLNEADRLAAQQKADEARRLYESVAERTRTAGNAAVRARALASIGGLLARAAKYGEARPYLEQALALAESANEARGAAGVARQLGRLSGGERKPAEARAWYERAGSLARTAGDVDLWVTTRFDIASLPATTPAESVELMRAALEAARELGDRSLEAKTRHSLGDFLFTAGDYAAAQPQLEAAAAIYEQLGDRESLARIYTSMGRLNRAHGRGDLAIPLYEKAIAIQREIGDRIGVIQSLNSMGVAFGALGQPARANEYYEKAYGLALELQDARVINFMRANLGGGLIETRDYARAAPLLEEALKGDVGPYASTRHSQLSIAYAGVGRLTEAREQAEAAVAAAADRPTQLPAAYLNRARARARQGDTKGALADAREAMTVVESIRAKLVPLDFLKQGYSATVQSTYSFLIGLYHRTGQPAMALEIAEQARARAFLDLMAARDVRLRASAERDVSELRQVRDELEAQGIDTDATAPAAEGSQPTAATGAKTAALVARWNSANPGLVSLVSARPLPLAELVATAKRCRSTIVSYWVADDASFIWVVSPAGRVNMQRVEVTRLRLDALVEGADASGRGPASAPHGRSRGASTAGQGSRRAWRELHGLLIEPVRAFLPGPGSLLTIVPHGSLQRLSFAALQDGQGRYLLEDYALHYVPAGALLSFTAGSTPKPGAETTYLLVADPTLASPKADEAKLAPLPGARAEVRAIARLLPRGAATVLVGADAERSTVEAAMQRASVVHLATHGVTVDGEPLDSYLALGAVAGTPGEGRLTARDVYGLDLQAGLVVLGSCRSAGGKVTGEGLSALVRALFYAGARSVVASVWDVSDDTARRALPAFYESWLRGRPPAESLRAAQLRLLADLRAGRATVATSAGEVSLPEHPALWAGFMLLGER